MWNSVFWDGPHRSIFPTTLGVSHLVAWQNFDGDRAPQTRVVRAKDFAHAALTDLGFNFIGAKLRYNRESFPWPDKPGLAISHLRQTDFWVLGLFHHS